MPKALWNDQVIAESEQVEIVEGNTYFPPGAIRRDSRSSTSISTGSSR